MLKASNTFAGRNFDAKKMTQIEKPNLGEKSAMRREVGKLSWPCPLALRLMKPTRDLLFVVSLHLTSQPDLLYCPPDPTWQTWAKIVTSFINSLHSALQSVAKFSLYVFFSFPEIFHASKVLTKRTVLEIKSNPAWTMLRDSQRTLKPVGLQN